MLQPMTLNCSVCEERRTYQQKSQKIQIPKRENDWNSSQIENLTPNLNWGGRLPLFYSQDLVFGPIRPFQLRTIQERLVTEFVSLR